MEPEGSSPYTQQLVDHPCPGPDASSPQLPTLFLLDQF